MALETEVDVLEGPLKTATGLNTAKFGEPSHPYTGLLLCGLGRDCLASLSHRATSTNGPVVDESGLVNALDSVHPELPPTRLGCALPRALAMRFYTIWCASRWSGDQRSTARCYALPF